MANYILVGASSTIASELIHQFGTKHQLFLLTRDLENLAPDLKKVYSCFEVDPKDQSQLLACVSDIASRVEIHGVVNFCGSLLLKPAHLITAEQWQNVISINLTTAFNVVHATAKIIQRNCALVLFSTAAAHIGIPNHEAIAAAKAGVEGLARSVAATYAPHNIRCNVIAPGLIKTTLTKPILNSKRGTQLSKSLHSLGRFGEPKDIASALSWLLDPQNAWITGEVIHLDGGLSTTKLFPAN